MIFKERKFCLKYDKRYETPTVSLYARKRGRQLEMAIKDFTVPGWQYKYTTDNTE